MDDDDFDEQSVQNWKARFQRSSSFEGGSLNLSSTGKTSRKATQLPKNVSKGRQKRPRRNSSSNLKLDNPKHDSLLYCSHAIVTDCSRKTTLEPNFQHHSSSKTECGGTPLCGDVQQVVGDTFLKSEHNDCNLLTGSEGRKIPTGFTQDSLTVEDKFESETLNGTMFLNSRVDDTEAQLSLSDSDESPAVIDLTGQESDSDIEGGNVCAGPEAGESQDEDNEGVIDNLSMGEEVVDLTMEESSLDSLIGGAVESDDFNATPGESAVDGISYSPINEASSSQCQRSVRKDTQVPSKWPYASSPVYTGMQGGRKRWKRKSKTPVLPTAKRQISLLSFLPSPSQSRTQSTTVCGNTHGGNGKRASGSLSNAGAHLASSSKHRGRTNTRPGLTSAVRSQDDEEITAPEMKLLSYSTGARSCPFYKRIPGMPFVVDAFQYGSIPGCSAYFLSHFHSDHYQGLTKKFSHPIFCSKVTANLVKHSLKVSAQYVHALPLNKPQVVEGVEVTLLDANHCPGSVMFLFKLSSGRNYLHTGDFRFSQAMKQYPSLTNCRIHQLYLDTTYCSPQHDFPQQEEVIRFAVQKTLSAVQNNPRTLVICGTYTIGKERVFMAVAEAIGSQVCVRREKKAILDCLESDVMAQRVTTDPTQAAVHVLPMHSLSMVDLEVYLDRLKLEYTSLLAFRPTGWTHSSRHLSLSSIRPQTNGTVTIFGIPYSEHSSFSELRQFVQFLGPQRIIPTVGNHSAKKRSEMQRYFHSWLSGETSSDPRTRQTTLQFASLGNR